MIILCHRYRGVPEDWNEYTVPEPIPLTAAGNAVEVQAVHDEYV